MADVITGLEELCQAIRAGDDRVSNERRREFAAKNWTSFVNAIDRIADADFAAGHYEAAARKLALLEELLPDVSGFFLRRAAAAVRADFPGVMEELAAAASRLSNDHEFFHAVEELVGNGRADLAARLLTECSRRDVFSAGVVAAAQSRILATTGRLTAAIDTLDAEMAKEKPNLTAMRCRYLLFEQMLDFDAAQQVSVRAAMLWGEERELRHCFERLLYLFDFDTGERLLRDAVVQHPKLAGLADTLAGTLTAAKAPAEAALLAHGPVAGAASAEIFAALSKPNTPTDLVLWGKLALVALLRSGRMTEADYTQFAWYLPSWEEGLIRNHILSAARRDVPYARSVQRGWLHYLVAHAAYADAALHSLGLLQSATDEDVLFFVLMLLRLQQADVVPPFMDAERFETMRAAALARAAESAPAFRCMMHDHFVALGGAPEAWPDAAMPPLSAPDAFGFRRFFAVTTGRLSRVSTGGARPVTAPIRPVLAISGQLRGFETAWSSLHDRLCRPTRAPVIVSVWDKTVNATGRHAKRLERALPEDVIAQLRPEDRYTDAFERCYPETYRLVFGQTDVDAQSLRALVDQSGCDVLAVETESEDMIARVLPPMVSPNMLKMYYKFARLEALIQDAETQLGNMFSHVIWSRPDCEILRLSSADLTACLARADLVRSSFTTETSFGDYVMILPRRAFSVLARIFPRVVSAGDTRLMPWRPNRSADPAKRTNLDAFGGPDVLFDVLLGAGYIPMARIPRIVLRLLGRTPGLEKVRQTFELERLQK